MSLTCRAGNFLCKVKALAGIKSERFERIYGREKVKELVDPSKNGGRKISACVER
jgi:hypothetical protein